ncbi:unnamed protein product, partial [Laminaria digitata]
RLGAWVVGGKGEKKTWRADRWIKERLFSRLRLLSWLVFFAHTAVPSRLTEVDRRSFGVRRPARSSAPSCWFLLFCFVFLFFFFSVFLLFFSFCLFLSFSLFLVLKGGWGIVNPDCSSLVHKHRKQQQSVQLS